MKLLQPMEYHYVVNGSPIITAAPVEGVAPESTYAGTVRCGSCAAFVTVAVDVPLLHVDDVRSVVLCASCLASAVALVKP